MVTGSKSRLPGSKAKGEFIKRSQGGREKLNLQVTKDWLSRHRQLRSEVGPNPNPPSLASSLSFEGTPFPIRGSDTWCIAPGSSRPQHVFYVLYDRGNGQADGSTQSSSKYKATHSTPSLLRHLLVSPHLWDVEVKIDKIRKVGDRCEVYLILRNLT